MKKEHIEYAMKLQPIGDLIIEISNLLGTNDTETLEKSVYRYQVASLDLQNVKPPEVIQDLHGRLNDALVVWIGVVKNLSMVGNNQNALEQLHAQKKAESVIMDIIDDIVKRLQDN